MPVPRFSRVSLLSQQENPAQSAHCKALLWECQSISIGSLLLKELQSFACLMQAAAACLPQGPKHRKEFLAELLAVKQKRKLSFLQSTQQQPRRKCSQSRCLTSLCPSAANPESCPLFQAQHTLVGACL